MGVKNSKKSKIIKINRKKEQELYPITSNSFEFKYVIGKGGFGKVWKVLYKKNMVLYALKQMSKAKIIEKKSERAIKYERDLLAKIHHPFIVNMHYAFQDSQNLYIVLDLLSGGDLRYHLSQNKKFSEEQTKFFVCCTILGLEYLHINNILHRDIKPENLVLDSKGYLRITDFGIAKIYQNINSTETSGTPGYMSPEVIIGHNHNQVVDYFALGVLTHEFMIGKRPYIGKNKKELKEKIIMNQFIIEKDKIPEGWSSEAADFINKLLQRKPANRLGLRSANEVKEHPWIKKYKWDDLYNKKIKPPFIPPEGDNFDKKYCNQEEKIGGALKKKYEKFLSDPNYANAFDNFDFYGDILNNNDALKKYKNIKNGENFIKEEFINPHINININNHIENNIINEENEEDIEKKIVKNIQESNSGSNQLLMRHYKKIDNFNKNDFIGNINEIDEYKIGNGFNNINIIPDDDE